MVHLSGCLAVSCHLTVYTKFRTPSFGNLYCSWNTARIRAGLPDVRMHDLRHSFASNLVNSGQSIYVVSKLLGHSQVKTTARYSHLSDATLLSAVDAAAMAIDKSWNQLQQKVA